ncbi:LuxR C-terminal-related transcriptional regulator [Pseudomonas sp. G.S.17]|uniref:helix-turn-helix transcriptional regulator n=1 Tax=Pseudomonas sp. G.S.17 TaxID=3137451 RepID=UPI00311CAAC4
METANSRNANLDPLIQQMVSSITELDSEYAIENALIWLRRECNCERAMFYQFRGSMLLTIVTSNVDSNWRHMYRRSRMLLEDPVVNYYREQLGFLDWRKAFQLDPPSSTYSEAVASHQLNPGCSYGYSHQGQGFQGVTSICSLNGLTRSLTGADKYLLSSLVPVLHMVGRGAKLRSRGLSEKEIEVLEWVREGKTTSEIASIRQIAAPTVKYHLKSIYNKLGVSNRAQAVGEALSQGIIK